MKRAKSLRLYWRPRTKTQGSSRVTQAARTTFTARTTSKPSTQMAYWAKRLAYHEGIHSSSLKTTMCLLKALLMIQLMCLRLIQFREGVWWILRTNLKTVRPQSLGSSPVTRDTSLVLSYQSRTISVKWSVSSRQGLKKSTQSPW